MASSTELPDAHEWADTVVEESVAFVKQAVLKALQETPRRLPVTVPLSAPLNVRERQTLTKWAAAKHWNVEFDTYEDCQPGYSDGYVRTLRYRLILTPTE